MSVEVAGDEGRQFSPRSPVEKEAPKRGRAMRPGRDKAERSSSQIPC